MAEPTLTLNSTWLRNRVAALGLRQWWLAEQMGVDRRTVLRWINGQVRTIQPAKAGQLAGVLGCRVHEMLLAEPAAELASAEDQRAAGLALAASTLLDRLGPVGEWDVAERLIKASAVPDLPVHVLGRLYHQLGVACWRQDKLDEAALHTEQALLLARRCDDRALLADALGSLANLRFWRGDLPGAHAAWAEALEQAPWLSPRQRGALHSNRGATRIETGEIEAGRAELHEALACFEIEGTPVNQAIVHGHLAMLALDAGDPAAAQPHVARAEGLARQADYRRGLALAALLRAELAALQGDEATARAALDEALAAYAAQGIDEAPTHTRASRVLCLLGRAEAACEAAARAMQRALGFPLELAAAQRALARAQAAAGDTTTARASAVAAAALYRRCGAPRAAETAAAEDPLSPPVTRQPGHGPLP